jgi:tetratricopeptide (TPR) repeat protein
MDLAEFIYNRVINLPGRSGLLVTLAVSCGIVLFAALLLATGKFRWFARSLGVLGVAVMMLVLWAFHEQTITEKQGPRVTVTTMRYPERTRLAVRAALLALPAMAAAVVVSVLLSTRNRLRAQVPRLLKAGRKHQVQKEFKTALREYNEAIRSAPHLAEAYCRRGSVYNAMGETALALADFDRALERDPELAPAYLARAKIRTESGDLDGALADFGLLMRIQANDPESYLNRGICLAKKGLWNEAIADFHRVLKLTNHSDFAEPAKSYLHQCEVQAEESLRQSDANGSPTLPSSPQPQAWEFPI